MPEDKHEKSVELTEQALEKLADGDDKAADSLIEQAKKLDKTGPQEVVRDLEEDAKATG